MDVQELGGGKIWEHMLEWWAEGGFESSNVWISRDPFIMQVYIISIAKKGGGLSASFFPDSTEDVLVKDG